MIHFLPKLFLFNYIFVPFFQRLKNFKKSLLFFLLGNQSQQLKNEKCAISTIYSVPNILILDISIFSEKCPK